MKYIVRTSEKGKKKSKAETDAKREELKSDIISSGKEYIEYTATLGSKNYKDQRIEEHCYIIEVL